MLTNFFGKSKPINFLIVSLFFIAGTICWGFFQLNVSPDLVYFSEMTITILLCLFMILLLDFIIRKNRMTETNTYSIFVFSCLLLMIPSLFFDWNMLLSNLFLLLALRRIFSIQSDKNLNKKILDASIWISVAMLFYFWSIIYFIPLLISIFLKSNKNYKHLLIPVSGIITVFILVSTFYVYRDNNFYWFKSLSTSYSLDFSPYLNFHLLLLASLIAIIIVIAVLKWLVKFPLTPKKNRPNHIIILISLIAGLIMALLNNEKNGSEFFLLFAPAAIMFANYIEMIKLNWIKEVLLWAMIVIPAIILVQ